MKIIKQQRNEEKQRKRLQMYFDKRRWKEGKEKK